jgi:Kef-type K+ transport system membrane component KefB
MSKRVAVSRREAQKIALIGGPATLILLALIAHGMWGMAWPSAFGFGFAVSAAGTALTYRSLLRDR